MHCVKIIRNIVLPGGVVFAASPASPVCKKDDVKEKPAIKPSELPIYSTPVECYSKPEPVNERYGSLEELVGSVRKEVTLYLDKAEVYKRKAWQTLQEQIDNSEDILNYLKEEENVLPRSGAIAVAGLAGYILGLRGGRFRRLTFTLIGAGSMAALCYPREAEEYLDTTLVLTKQYVLIAYHFLSQTPRPSPALLNKRKSLTEEECIERINDLCELRGTCPPFDSLPHPENRRPT